MDGARLRAEAVRCFGSVQPMCHAQGIAAFADAVGAMAVVLAVGWAAAVLRLQRRRIVRRG